MLIALGASAASAQGNAIADVSDSALGKSLAAQAHDRFKAKGVVVESLRVWKDAIGYLVAPEDASLSIGADGVLQPLTAPDPNAKEATLDNGKADREVGATNESFETQASTAWTLVASQCFARIYSGVNAAAMDHCYQLHKLKNESSTTRDYYALQRYATVFAGGCGAKWASIEADDITPQTWVDWSPKGNTTSNCTSVTLSITMGGYGISYPVTRCESWSFTKRNPEVYYKLRWDGPVQNTNRELAFQIGVSVAQGAWPQWGVGARVQADG